MGGNITHLPETELMFSFFLYILEYQKRYKLTEIVYFMEKKNKALFAVQRLKHTTSIEKALRSAGTSMH